MSYRDPTEEELESPLFNAIWDTIKKWDINVPDEYNGYTTATGAHVCAITDAVSASHRDVIGPRLGNPLVSPNKYFDEGVRLCQPFLKLLEDGTFKEMRWVDVISASNAVKSIMRHADEMQKQLAGDMGSGNCAAQEKKEEQKQ